jgi:hypothetical protein
VIWAGLPARIVALLAGKRIYDGDRKKKKARKGSSLSYLCHSCRVALCRWLVGISSSKRWKLHTPFRVMGVKDRLPCYLTTSIGLMLLTCELSPHSQRVGHCTIQMVKWLRQLVHHALSQSWVQKCVTPGFKAKPDAHRMYAQDQVVIHTVRM